jgi:hypothetical protein
MYDEIIRLFFLAAFCGVVEGKLMARIPDGSTGPKILWGHFSEYHFWLFGMIYFFHWNITGEILLTIYSGILFMPGIIIVQDFFSILQPKWKIEFGKWHKWPVGKLWFLKIPNFYWGMFFTQGTFIWLNEILKGVL